MYQLKQKTGYFFKVWSSLFQPTVFPLPIVQPCSLLYLFEYFHYVLLPPTLQNKCFPSSLSQHLTYLPTSAWKSLLRRPSAIVRAGTGLPRAEQGGTRPEAETSRAEGARRAGIVVGAAGMLCCWEVMATGREEPRRSYPPQTSAPARQSAWRMVLHHHSAWLESPSSRSGLWSPAAEGKWGCYFLKKPYLASVHQLRGGRCSSQAQVCHF